MLALASACASSDAADPPLDAAPRPLEPAGRYAATSSFSLAAPPPAAATVLDELLAATDGPDDPSRYLIDLMIERLPEGRTRSYATAVAPYVAAYINEHLDEVAPRFVPGSRALSTGLARIAHRFGTLEELVIDASGNSVRAVAVATSRAGATSSADATSSALALAAATSGTRRTAWRTIVGLRFALDAASHGVPGSTATSVDVRFAPLGLPDTAAATQVVIDDGAARNELALGFEPHSIALPYTALLRVGFDYAVIPSVVPGAHDLAHALTALVDCDHLGALVSDWIGLGSPAFYAQGCTVALTALAARIYARLDAIEASAVELELAGTVRASDSDGDRQADALLEGTWTGSFAGSSVAGRFAGTRE